jgi:hypothetical protein
MTPSRRRRRIVTTRAATVVALTILISGCTHHRSIALAPRSASAEARRLPPPPRLRRTGQPGVDALSQDLRGRAVSLTLASGSRVEARDAQLDGRSLTWRRAETNAPQPMDLAETREVSVRSRARGALDGLLIGLAIGLPAGALIIDAPKGGLGNRGQAALSGGVSIGILSAAIGALRGDRIVYRITPPPGASGERHARPSAPPPQ